MTIPEAYKVLGLTETATSQEVKKVFRTLAHKYHPDKEGGDALKFTELANAYERLKNHINFSFNVGAPVAGSIDYSEIQKEKDDENYWSLVHSMEVILEQKKIAYSKQVRKRVYEEAKKLGKQVKRIEIDHVTGAFEVYYHSEMLE